MNEADRLKIISNDYADLIIEYQVNLNRIDAISGEAINYLTDTFATIHFPANEISQKLMSESGYAVIPKVYGIVDTLNLDAMGVNKIRNTPALDLYGNGVLIGIVDTGIEYTNQVFKDSDNTTRIISIWDQTIENLSASENIYYYGKEFTASDINRALMSDDPFSIVPSFDEIGHGTTIAGLAGGSILKEEDFSGVAPLTELVVVKLKQTKKNLKDFLFIPEEVISYQENDIIAGVMYLVSVARKLDRPIAICIALGTNMGGHDGRSALPLTISQLGEKNGIAIVVAAGNEGSAGHHYFGVVDNILGYDNVELNVGEDENGFSMELWGQVPGIYSIDIQSPTGEYIPRIPARLNESRVVRFIFERTILYIDYLIIEAQTGDQLIFMRFIDPAPGIWKFRVYGGGDITTGFHIWLPMSGFIVENTKFINPNPDTTITNPGNAQIPITVTAYNYRNQSIYLEASRGFTRDNIIKPELTAPGVEVYGPKNDGSFGVYSGTSIAAAETTGLCAMLLEWGIVKGNFLFMDSIEIKKFLMRGVRRIDNSTYPNRIWGFGVVDIYRTFISLRGE